MSSIKFQKIIATVAVLLFAIKIIAAYLTNSAAVLTDALESLVNVIAGFLGLYSVWLASKPKDKNHPYGHGKIEYVSASIEGTLITIAGILIIVTTIEKIKNPEPLESVYEGLILVSITAVINFLVGYYAKRFGTQKHSPAVAAGGAHLMSDAYSTLGIILGLVLVKLTGWIMVDYIIALIFGGIIIYTGIKLIRQSLAGIMDEADIKFLKGFIAFLETHRKNDWIDLHNLRIIKYGAVIHIDAHMTLPWYYNVLEAHQCVKDLEELIKVQYDTTVELFIHIDACKFESCKICCIKRCPVRQQPYQQHLEWSLENVLRNKQHEI